MAEEFNRALGERIRARRKEKKLTQAQLADGFITRNMICRIESGDATPSIPTLLNIAEKLDVPIGYFFARDKREEAVFLRNETIGEIRTSLRNSDYDACIRLCLSRAEFEYDDEAVFVRSIALIRLAEEDLEEYRLASARGKFVAAAESIVNSAYLTDMIARYAVFQCLLIDCAISDCISEECLSEDYVKFGTLSAEMYVYLSYLRALDLGENEKLYIPLLTNPDHCDFARAKTLTEEGNFAEAASIYERLSAKSHYITAYRSANALEVCYEKTGDYRGAYSAAKRRLDLMKLFTL